MTAGDHPTPEPGDGRPGDVDADGSTSGIGPAPADDAGAGSGADGRAVEPSASTPLPFRDLEAPAPLDAAPPVAARWLAFGSILVGGLLGGLIGYGTADIMLDGDLWAPLGGLVGALICAVGVGVVANLTLQAMNEWNAVDHPEATGRGGRAGRPPRTGRRPR